MKTEKQDKVRLFRRILLSYLDFEQASITSSHILKAKLHDNYPNEDRHILQALNCAMIVAYARPFSGNRGSKITLPALPRTFLSGFTPEEHALHKIVIADRNQLLAHSDHAGWNLRLSFIRSPGRRPMLVPLHRGTRDPLDEKHTQMFQRMADKLIEATFAQRRILEEELTDAFPTLSLDDGRVTGDELAMHYGGWS